MNGSAQIEGGRGYVAASGGKHSEASGTSRQDRRNFMNLKKREKAGPGLLLLGGLEPEADLPSARRLKRAVQVLSGIGHIPKPAP